MRRSCVIFVPTCTNIAINHYRQPHKLSPANPVQLSVAMPTAGSKRSRSLGASSTTAKSSTQSAGTSKVCPITIVDSDTEQQLDKSVGKGRRSPASAVSPNGSDKKEPSINGPTSYNKVYSRDVVVVFPNQLFLEHPALTSAEALKGGTTRVMLVEDPLLFGGDTKYPATFHKQKLWLHRATMKRYQALLESGGGGGGDAGAVDVVYIDYNVTDNMKMRLERGAQDIITSASNVAAESTAANGIHIITLDPVDFILKLRLEKACASLGWQLTFLPCPGFLNTKEDNDRYRNGKDPSKKWLMADFYKNQRKRLNVLVSDDEHQLPYGGKWSFDTDNRKKVPKGALKDIPHHLLQLRRDDIDTEAVTYINTHFPKNPGSIAKLYYPTSHADAKKWLGHFLKMKLAQFGEYEDAMVEGESWLWHSVLTPSLNIGLLTPQEILSDVLAYSSCKTTTTTGGGGGKVPLNSLEGFIRQIIGWREFMRATYEDLGVKMRTTNYWNHTRKLPNCFYTATTGILPIDDTIKRILATGYCHHIERLMVLGGFLFLCEIDPNEIYRWFMEMFVDSYDWVMVTNVYAMSQNADGGLITTKPYFSGSAYVRKMSHYKAGEWCDVWDGLYWRWVYLHSSTLRSNPRWAMMCSASVSMDAAKRDKHMHNADTFLARLDKENTATTTTTTPSKKK